MMRQAAKGFSLIEVMVSLTILGLALAVAVSLLPSISLSSQTAERQLLAVQLARSTFEEYRSQAALTVGVYEDTITRDEVELARRVEVLAETGATDVLQETYRLRIRVQWNEKNNRTRMVYREGIVSTEW